MYNELVTLAKQLYPTGRAFRMPVSSDFEKLTKALTYSEERWYNDAHAFMDSLLPDNSNFTVDDASDWERRLGLSDGSLNTLSNRKLAILRKLNQPGINPARGHYIYLQTQLQLAGFNVYIYENIPANTPASYGYPSTTTNLQYGSGQYGLTSFGLNFLNVIANHIDEVKDMSFNMGGTYKLSFFVGGLVTGTSANVPLARKDEFRQLILKLKPVQNVGLLYINYI